MAKFYLFSVLFLCSLQAFSGEAVRFFPEKSGGSDVTFLKVDGDIVARYKTLDDQFGQYFIETKVFSKYATEDGYPIGGFPGSLSVAKVRTGYSIRKKKVDVRVSSSCTLDYNGYLAVYDNKRRIVKEYMLLYELVSDFVGGLDDCPNSVGKKNTYRSKFASFGGPIFLNKEESKLFVVGGGRLGEYDFVLEMSVEEDGSLDLSKICDCERLYHADVGMVRRLMLNDEVDYQKAIDTLEKNIRNQRNLLCQ